MDRGLDIRYGITRLRRWRIRRRALPGRAPHENFGICRAPGDRQLDPERVEHRGEAGQVRHQVGQLLELRLPRRDGGEGGGAAGRGGGKTTAGRRGGGKTTLLQPVLVDAVEDGLAAVARVAADAADVLDRHLEKQDVNVIVRTCALFPLMLTNVLILLVFVVLTFQSINQSEFRSWWSICEYLTLYD